MQAEQGIESTIVIFGSARILPGDVAAQRRAEAQRSGGKLGLAKRADSRAQPSRILTRNPLIDVRTSTITVAPTAATLP